MSEKRGPGGAFPQQTAQPPLALQKLRTALGLHQRGDLAQAETLYREVLAAMPNNSDALHFLGVLQTQLGRKEAGLSLIDRAIAANANNVAAHYNRANVLRDLSRLDEAVAAFSRVLALKSDHVGAHNNLGVTLSDLGRYGESLASHERVIALRPDHPDGYSNRGGVLIELGRSEEALSSYEKAIAIARDNVAAHFGRGNALVCLGRLDEAVASFNDALTLAPSDVRILNNCGNALERLNRYDEALASFDRAIAIDPAHAEAYNNRGNVYIRLRRYADAVASYDQALHLRPDYAEALYGRGYALVELKRHDEAIATYRELLRVKPDYRYGWGMLLHAKRTACDWSDSAAIIARTVQGIREGKPVASPLALFAVSDSTEDNARCSRILVKDKYKAAAQPLWRGERYRHDRIRLAYVSADFNAHAVATQIAGVFEHHDKTRFETIAISHGLDDGSEMRRRLERAFDRFIDVTNRSDFDIASLIRQIEADIAIDLTGLTGMGRPGIFAFRPAGLQAQHLGFAGTMGADYIDYILADEIVIPEEQRRFYSENVVYLPHSYMPNDSLRAIGTMPSRSAAGLPADGFVFCSFNNSYKFSPEMFDIWMRLLGAVEGSVLWLPAVGETAERNLVREAEARGVAGQRLVFAGYVPSAKDHLARLALADLFLDTLPYNAHSSASDALWAGLPVLTRLGNTFAGRVGASMLEACGLPELIAQSPAAYEALALRLARDPPALAEVRAKLARNRAVCPLFDTAGFTRGLEAAYTIMWERHQHGGAPESFRVPRAAASAP